MNTDMKVDVDFSDLEKEMHLLQEKMQERGKKAFTENCKQIFNDNPDLTSFRWTQYTPYFNDGDECRFGVYDWLTVRFNDGLKLEDWTHGSRKYNKKDINPKYMDSADAAHKLVAAVPKNVMKKIFGDHVQVTVFRDKIEVEEYEHE